MRTIWKYEVKLTDTFDIEMPQGARVLAVQNQDGTPQMWVMVDPTAPPEWKTFRVAGTGHALEDGYYYKHVGTFQLRDGALIFHVFEVPHTFSNSQTSAATGR